MTFDPSFVSNLILVLTGFGGAFLAALWISLVIWTYRDIRTRRAIRWCRSWRHCWWRS